jgi:flagellar biosynthetic protein FliP
MGPTWNEINDKALQPFLNEEISQTDALKKAEMPLKTFMLKQTREKDLSLFIEISGENPTTNEEIDIRSLIPAQLENLGGLSAPNCSL